MKLTPLPIIKEDERGTIWDCDSYNFISRKKGTVRANHVHEGAETLYLVLGRAELTVGDQTQIVEALIKIEIEADQYHQLIALTDIGLLENRDLEY